MDAMKEVIKKKRMKLLEDLMAMEDGHEMSVEIEMEPKEDEMSEEMAGKKEVESNPDLAPPVKEGMPKKALALEMEMKKPEMNEEEAIASQLYSEGDEEKPGIIGKAAMKMKKMLKKA